MTPINSEPVRCVGTDPATAACRSPAATFLEQFDHDLRTPLGTMAAAVELLRDEVPGSPAHTESIAVLERQIARMHALTQTLRDFSQRFDR